jgi:hypothetical protein
MYCILTGFDMRIKVVRPSKMRLIETCSKVRVGRCLSHTCPIQNCLKQGDVLSPLFFNFTLHSVIRKVQEYLQGFKLSRPVSFCFILLTICFCENIKTVKKEREAPIDVNKESF